MQARASFWGVQGVPGGSVGRPLGPLSGLDALMCALGESHSRAGESFILGFSGDPRGLRCARLAPVLESSGHFTPFCRIVLSCKREHRFGGSRESRGSPRVTLLAPPERIPEALGGSRASSAPRGAPGGHSGELRALPGGHLGGNFDPWRILWDQFGLTFWKVLCLGAVSGVASFVRFRKFVPGGRNAYQLRFSSHTMACSLTIKTYCARFEAHSNYPGSPQRLSVMFEFAHNKFFT